MEATYNSNESILSIVTKVAALLSEDEKGETGKTAATAATSSPTSITKTRTKIFESLLKPHLADNPISSRLDVLPQCEKLLDEQAAYLSLSLGNNIANRLQNIYKCKEAQAYNKNQNEREPKRESVVGKQSKMMMARPLRLESNPGFERHLEISFHPSNRPLLRSIENMRESLKPICFRQKTNFNLRDIAAMRSAQKSLKKSILCCSVLKDSMSLIRESQRRSRHLKVNLPLREKCKEDAVRESNDSDRLTLPLSLEKHFVSDQIVSNELKWHEDRTLQLIFIDMPLLIDHLKKAAAGLQSETISCQDDGSLKLKPNITLSTVLPELLAEFAEPFLSSGRAFRRLSARTKWHHVANHVERPLNRTLRHAVITFLSNCRLFLLSLPAENLSQLLHGAAPTMKMVQQFDLMFQFEEGTNKVEGMQKICGINIMRFVCSFINVNTDSQFSQLLIYLLKLLCETYFAQLQRWIYYGELEEPFNELFISSCPQKVANERSRDFFERAYYIRSEAVPGFLEGCEQAILQCGKYNRFLKNYNRQHPVFSLKYPKMDVCLSELQISRMREQLELHYKQTVEKIEPFDIKSMFRKQKENSQRFGNRMWDCTQAYIAAWQTEKQELQLKANERKQRRYEELNKQREQQEQLQMEHKRFEVLLELEYQEKREQLEERRLLDQKKALEGHVNALTVAAATDGADLSPDDSTSSNRSFVTCNEPDLDMLIARSEPDLPQTTNQSDVLNSNKSDSDLARNRMRNNSSEQFRECQMHVELFQVPTTSIICLSEAERNRMRVLNCTEEQTVSKLPKDMNMNLEDISDLHRNRQRMQKHNTFSSEYFEVAATVELERRFMKPDTGLARNCQRVMGGDFKSTECLGKVNLNLPLEPEELWVEFSSEVATPMSTTSDVDLEEAVQVEVDAVNNNNVTNNTDSPVQQKNPDQSPITAAAVEPEPEPEPKPEPESQPEPDAKKTQKRIFSLPNMRTDVEQQFARIEHVKQKPFIIKGYLQLSVVAPLQLHLSMLRKEVLRVFHEKNIFEYFCDLRKYFFLLDGEFGTLLINGILEQIESGIAPNILCQKSVLDSLLNNAMVNGVRDVTTSAQIMDNLELNCSNIPKYFDLMDINLLSIFQLDCKMEWPLNLVFSVETMEKYAQIFSYLLKLRHVSFVMDRAYVSFQEASKMHGRALQKSSQYRHLQMIRHKLSHFVNTLQNHLVTNALEGTWKSFTDGLNNVECIEGLYQRHVDYLKEIAFLSLLNRRSAKFRETIDNILVIALRFCKILDSKSFLLDEENQFVHPRYKRLVYEEAELEKFIRYAIYLGIKVAASGYQEKIVDLIRIINYNGYYNVSDSTNEIKK